MTSPHSKVQRPWHPEGFAQLLPSLCLALDMPLPDIAATSPPLHLPLLSAPIGMRESGGDVEKGDVEPGKEDNKIFINKHLRPKDSLN